MSRIPFILLTLLFSAHLRAETDTLRKSPAIVYDLPWDLEDLALSPERIEQHLDIIEQTSTSRTAIFSADHLASIPGITALDIAKLTTEKDWKTMEMELGSVRSRQIMPFFQTTSPARLHLRSRYQLEPEMKEEKGIQDNVVHGPPGKVYNRLRLSYYGFTLGLLQVKEAGEARFFDRYGGYLALAQRTKLTEDLTIDRLVLGDFDLAFGSGLLFAGSGMIGKSNDVIDAAEPSTASIRGYTSSSIASGFRGLTTTISLSDFAISGFYSSRRYDAVIDSGIATSIDIDGYHRTQPELDKRDKLGATLFGGRLEYLTEDRSKHVGVTAFTEQLDHPVQGRGFEYRFRGQQLDMASLDLAMTEGIVSISAEAAMSKTIAGSASAVTSSILLNLTPELRASLNGRYLPHNFVSRHGATFGESADDVQNERGVYLGVSWMPFSELLINTYADLASTFVPAYSNSKITQGSDFLFYSNYQRNSTDLALKVRLRRKSTDGNLEDGSIRYRRQTNIRLEVDHIFNEVISSRSKAEFVEVDLGNGWQVTQGVLVSQRFTIAPTEWLSLDGLLAFFTTDDYESRLYLYEYDMPGASTLSMFYDTGIRWSLGARYQLWDEIAVGAKFSQTRYPESRNFGSGITQRTGQTDSRFLAQVDVTM